MSFYSYNLKDNLILVDDFLNISGDTNWTISKAGGATNFSLGESGHPGITRFHLGTANISRNIWGKGTGAFTFGYGQLTINSVVRFPFTGTSGSNDYVASYGFAGITGTNTIVNGAYFEYNSSGNGNFLVAVTMYKGAQTRTVTSTSINTGTWYYTSIDCNANGSKVDFYINKQLTASHITNIPTGDVFFTVGLSTTRTTGTTNDGVLDVDLLVLSCKNNVDIF